MHVLAIDVGSYSVKYISSFVEKRKVNHVEMSEIILRDYMNDHPELNTLNAQSTIVQEIIDSTARPDTRVIFQNDNEMIAQTYKIDPDEAIFYKHQNAFLLTSTQFEEVDQAQKDFASAMDKTLSQLVSDFSRWKIGFKVNYGLSLQHIFITGGTSNIKNIANYLTEKWDVKVALLETFDKIEGEKIDLNPKNKSKYALTNMMATGMKRKNRFINFLSGKFAQASAAEIPLHSFAFLGVRVAAVSAVLLVSLMAERFFIERDVKFVNLKLNTIMKSEVLAINGRLRRSLALNPKPILDSMVRRKKGIRQEISTIQSAIEIKALNPLVTISQLAASTQTTLIEFKSSDFGDITAIFSAEAASELNNLKAQLERSTFSDVLIEIDQPKLQLKLTATDH
jgi:hypothetical protein